MKKNITIIVLLLVAAFLFGLVTKHKEHIDGYTKNTVEVTTKLDQCWAKQLQAKAQCQEEVGQVQEAFELLGAFCIMQVESCEDELAECLTNGLKR